MDQVIFRQGIVVIGPLGLVFTVRCAARDQSHVLHVGLPVRAAFSLSQSI